MSIVYFDKGTFSQLWRERAFSERDLRRVRSRFASRYFARRQRLLIGPKLISELAALYGHDQFERERAFLQQLPDPLYLAPFGECVREEVVAFAAERVAEPFMSNEVLAAVLSGSVELWDAERMRLEKEKEIFRCEEFASKTGLSDDLSTEAACSGVTVERLRRQKVEDWFSDPVALISDWATEFMRRNRSDMNLGDDESLWPSPRRLPTIWGYCSFKLARLYLQLRDDRRIDPNDVLDWRHYAAAMHADELVVDDRRFRSIVDRCPSPGPKPISFREWAENVLDSR